MRLKRFDDYLEVTGTAQSTRRSYRYVLVRFYADTLLDPAEATEDDIVAYVAAQDPHGQMRGLILRGLKAFYRWAEGREMSHDPTARLRTPRLRAAPAPTLSRTDVTRLLAAAFRHDDLRGWAIMLAYATGARRGSICELRPGDIDLHSDRVIYREAKGDRPYAVPLGRMGRVAARHLLAYGRDPVLGVRPATFWTWVRDASAESGVRAHPHLLRHAFATNIARTSDPDTWRRLMNHSDLSQFARYVAGDDERLREAVEHL